MQSKRENEIINETHWIVCTTISRFFFFLSFDCKNKFLFNKNVGRNGIKKKTRELYKWFLFLTSAFSSAIHSQLKFRVIFFSSSLTFCKWIFLQPYRILYFCLHRIYCLYIPFHNNSIEFYNFCRWLCIWMPSFSWAF